MCDIKKNPIFTKFKESIDGKPLPDSDDEEEMKPKPKPTLQDRLDNLKETFAKR